ncbi:MAG: serine/threonine-protein kinase [Acidobacteriota bacterium]
MAAATVGCTLAHYHLEQPLGVGGMGIVFLAQDTHLCRSVAIKVLPGDRLDPQARRRLREEALTLSRLSHPNVAAVFDFGSHGDIDYLVMEFVPGTTLDAMLKDGPLDTATVASLGAQLGRGLAAAHASGIVHRDIKPGNLRVTPYGLLKILDFGVATFASPGNASTTTTVAFDSTPGLTGTIQYMPPERLRGTPAGPRADIFSAGAVLYEMACGRAPFNDPQPVRLIESILCGRLARPSRINPGVDRALESIILRALDPDPDRRFGRAADLAAALESLAVPAPGSRRGSSGALSRWVTRVASSVIV